LDLIPFDGMCFIFNNYHHYHHYQFLQRHN